MIENIFQSLPTKTNLEEFHDLLVAPNVRIERIISPAGCKTSEEWYDQKENEWVMVLQGKGVIIFEDTKIVTMKAGDHLLIPAHQKHRVIKTDEHEDTIWLAVFH